jgi:thiol-disulfide isomerase/thioredoxin
MINTIQTQEQFFEIINNDSDTLYIVFAYGQGCGPCASTKPKYEMVSNYFNKLGANIEFYMMDMWDANNRQFSKDMGIEVVPTFWGYFRGKRIWQASGGLDTPVQKSAILSIIENIKLNYEVKI